MKIRAIAFVLFTFAVASLSAQGLLQNRNRSTGGNSPLTPKTVASQQNAVRSAASTQKYEGDREMQKGTKSIQFKEAALDLVFQAYGELTGKTILKDPNAPSPTITLQPQKDQQLTDEEKLLAIETVLEMNGIHLEPYGDKFMRALPRKDARKESIPLILDPESELPETMNVVSLLLPFRNIGIEEAQKALEGLKSSNTQLNAFERTNAILITDTSANVNRMREIAKTIDVPTPVTENVFVRQIKNASAADIKTALEAIVQDSQKELEKNGKAPSTQSSTPQTNNRPSLLGSMRNGGKNNQPAAPTANESLLTSVSDADRGMIRGKVLILSDERSNKLIIVTSKTNMDFFDKVIEQLDIETTPDTVVKVYRLKYADAEDVSDMVNDLIGNAASSKGSKGNQNQNAKAGGNSNVTKNNSTPAKKSANQRSGEAKAGELSKENTTVLADKRINGLVVMTNKELVPVVEQIIESMDIKLSQVLIETMILQVALSDDLATGIDWVAPFRRGELIKGGLSGGGGDNLSAAAAAATAATAPLTAGINALAFFDKIDLGAVIQASKSDSRTKLVASPIIMTVDNKEATIEATKMRYLLKGYTYSGSTYNGSAVPDYEQKEIGLTVKVTPKINPNGTVMLEVEEEFSALGESQTIQASTGGTTNSSGTTQQAIGGIPVDTTVTRKLSADITVENRQTVVLGGLTQTDISNVETGIPLLKDIPWIGKYLFGKTKQVETRQELLMFLTPYVLDDAEAATAEARRRKLSMSDEKPWDDHGWSDSPLKDPVELKELLKRKEREWKKQDDEYEAQLELNKKNQTRVRELIDRQQKINAERAKEAKEIAEQINAAEEKRAEARAEADVKKREDAAPLLNELKEEAK